MANTSAVYARIDTNLKENADLRWNICTEADEMEAAVFDHYVFFVMSPKNFDQE